MKNTEQLRSGYCVLSETIAEYELVWRTEDEEGIIYPCIYNTEREARYEIADDIIGDLQEFKSRQREWDEVHWENQYIIGSINIDENNIISVWDNDGSEILIMSLQDWREQL